MRLLAFVGGFDGQTRYMPGVVDVSTDHARLVLRLGNGVLVGEDDQPLSAEDSAKKLGLDPATITVKDFGLGVDQL